MTLKRRVSFEDEKIVRRQFYVEKVDPRILCAQWKISEQTLRKIIGGPLYRKDQGIERYYGA